MDRRWLTARRDALIDKALAATVAPLALLTFLLLDGMPPIALAALGGFGAGALIARIEKKIPKFAQQRVTAKHRIPLPIWEKPLLNASVLSK